VLTVEDMFFQGVSMVMMGLLAVYSTEADVKVGELLLGHRSPAVLQCNKGRSHPHTVYWTFNGNPVPYGMNRFYTRGRNLTIYSSSVQDNGTYKCFGDYDRRSELDTFVIRIVSPVQFDSCGGEYCTEEIDVSSLHAKNVSSVFLSSSFTYDMNSPVKEKESAENVEWRLTENSDINIDKYCFGANHESCVLAKCGERETDACQTTAVLRGAVRDVWSRQNKSIVLNVKRLEKDLVGRMDHVTVVLRVNLPYRRNVLGKARNWVVVRAFKLYNFPTSITVTSKNCTEQDNSQCKIIVDEGESLTLCSSVDTHGRESFINSSSWIFTTKSATFNASLCTSYDSSECRNLYRRRMLVVQKEWGSCLVLKNISEELDGTRVKYRMIPAFQAKVNSILESREMTINVLTGSYVQLDLHRVLAYQIKTHLLEDSIADGSHVKITIPFDKITFTGGLVSLGLMVGTNTLGLPVYGIRSCADLKWCLGKHWYQGVFSHNGSGNVRFSYIDPTSIRFYLKPLKPVKEIYPDGHFKTSGGHVLVFEFKKLIGIGKEQWDAVTGTE
jgi:hypothetical protein